MNWGILAFVIIYEVLTVVGVGLVIARKNKHSVEEPSMVKASVTPTCAVGSPFPASAKFPSSTLCLFFRSREHL